MSEPILSIKGITKHFGGIKAVDQVSFDVQQGEVLGLMGPSWGEPNPLLRISMIFFLSMAWAMARRKSKFANHDSLTGSTKGLRVLGLRPEF